MISSFRMTPNVTKGGETLTLEVQGVSKTSEYLGKVFTIRIIEVDVGRDNGNSGTKNDALAEFSAEITNTGTRANPKLYFEKATRTDTNPASLPPVIPRKSLQGDALSFVPDWKVAHLNLNFSTSTGPSGNFLILIRGEPGERENYSYEIGFQILVEGKSFFDSTKTPTLLDCSESVASNCKMAALALFSDHKELIIKRGIGTHYGSNYEPPDPAVFAKQKSDYQLGKISCIGYLLEAGKYGHEKTMAIADWKSVLGFMRDGKGTTLAKGLEKVGWEGIYYNLDTFNPIDKGYAYNTPHLKWEEHSYSYSVAKKNRRYYGLIVHDLLINFRPTEKYWDDTPVLKKTNKESAKVSKLKSIPFGFLNAWGGEHTAIVVSGDVYEVHWSKGPDEADLFEKKDFETQWGWPWLTGIIHVPPGSWT
jgi:hypothetical protein